MSEKSVVENQQRKWVELRTKCTIESIVAELYSVIEHDVRTFNRLHPNHDYEFRTNEFTNRDGVLIRTVAKIDKQFNEAVDNQQIRIELHDNKICVFFGVAPQFEIVPKWNEDDLKCDLKVENKCYTIYQLSQKIIGDFLFSDL